MTKQTQEALKMAYDWLNEYAPPEVVQACKEALDTEQVREDDAQPAQEPVAWVWILNNDVGHMVFASSCDAIKARSSFPASVAGGMVINKVQVLGNIHPAPSWQGLSDAEITELLVSKGETSMKYVEFARAIEQALKEKNT